MNRHHQARRSNSSIAPKVEPSAVHPHAPVITNPPPQSRPTPPSHASSPSSHSPGFGPPGVMTPPASDSQVSQHRIQQPFKPQLPNGPQLVNAGHMRPNLARAMKGPGGTGAGSMPPGPSKYYHSPFQHHIEQLGKLSHPLVIYFIRAMFVLD